MQNSDDLPQFSHLNQLKDSRHEMFEFYPKHKQTVRAYLPFKNIEKK